MEYPSKLIESAVNEISRLPGIGKKSALRLAFYMSKKIASFGIQLSTIARGIPIGGEIEFADEVTLGRSIQTRITYK